MTCPYTYYLYHKITGKKYYGVRWAKNCNPSDLWVSYFTSSKKVKKLISTYGKDSFQVQVRKTFNSKQDAIEWEEKVLRRLRVHKKEEWLNVCVNKSIRYDVHPRIGVSLSEETKNKIAESNKGKVRTSEVRKAMSENRKGKNHWNYGNTWTDEVKLRNKESNLRYLKNNPDKVKRPPSRLGSKASEETKRKMSEARKKYWENRKKCLKDTATSRLC